VLGIKDLNVANWREPDEANALFGEIDRYTGQARILDGDDWAARFLAVELSEQTPEDVRTMWAAARGALAYGAFFYPMYALGDEQLHRVADAAVLHRYEQLNGPRLPSGRWPDLKPRLDWLIARGVISRELEQRWDAIRNLRNFASHATFQRLQTPGQALQTLEILREEINGLFAEPGV
jgi:hypothetical protein